MHRFILEAFGYYASEALAAYALQLDYEASRCYDPEDSQAPRLTHVIPDLCDIARDFDLPLTIVGDPDEDHDLREYTISTAAARVHSRQVLEPPRQGTFAFMELPPELRETVLKMLLIFPKPGLALAAMGTGVGLYTEWQNRLGLPSRDDSQWKLPELRDLTTNPPEIDVAVNSLAETLAIMGVSKQIRHEALTPYQLQNFQELLPELCLQNLVLICLQHTSFWEFCCGRVSEDRPATLSETSRLDRIKGFDAFIALVKRAKQVEISGDGFMGVWLREKITGSDMVQGDGEVAGREK
ncbi:hypothetical protein CERZMDRAFT_101149 [Cercospora zeae-maydis SCOH1-5]|uniref:Uncharacterized protein n=1 Tax=Cercospora zeae-maydis SCOH1-5 TaxID=717836 RepID=A0A6A6F836_9PEZI|nr:hypothetical protein CERZMDRAFT_101149 [Cercospora zeae-maydis SCOH1-5]